MPRPSSQLISLSETPFYHCVSRCVRRAFLCGTDAYSGQCYEHRRGWLEKQLLFAADVFAIKICSYAIMSNHYHVVLHVRPDLAEEWSDLEVVKRWHRIFNGTLISTRFLNSEPLSSSEHDTLKPLILLWRERLTNISWLMRVVNERIARRANAEDDCTGSFWEGRFKSQALLDAQALLSCMAYVDLNPVRAGLAKTPSQSKFTSCPKRIAQLNLSNKGPNCLAKFVGGSADRIGIPYALGDYLELLDWTSKTIISRGEFAPSPSQKAFVLLNSINLEPNTWNILTTEFETRFSSWVGSEQIVQSIYRRLSYQRLPSTKNHRILFQ